jgi:tRNA (guanosine-2'-O-)-methyltransferase
MFGMIQSLNVSVACAIILYEALRQRLERGYYAKSDLPQKKLKKLLAEWGQK